jgi:predicted Zn-dependent protease
MQDEVNEQSLPKKRPSSEVQKRGYSDQEVETIYLLARVMLENGRMREAALILKGLNEVAPNFSPAWVARSALALLNGDTPEAVLTAERGVKADTESPYAMVFFVTALLSSGDYNTAGSFLGEIGERIQAGEIDDPHLKSFYKAQLIRYENR